MRKGVALRASNTKLSTHDAYKTTAQDDLLVLGVLRISSIGLHQSFFATEAAEQKRNDVSR